MNKMKKAVIDQILLWIVLFTIFVSFLFFVIEYSNAIKVKDNADAISDYMARMVSLNMSNDEIATGINNIKEDYFNDISSDNIICNIDVNESNYQVITNVYATLVNGFLTVSNNNIHSKTVVFNEKNENEIECTLTLTFK